MEIKNYNKLIHIKFFTADNQDRDNPDAEIICPKRGRKPNIEINGFFVPSDVAQSFEVKVRNLYLDLARKNYTKIEVTAGYENETRLAFRGNINYAFKETPGPESVTVFQCLGADIDKWSDKQISITMDEGYSFKDALETICKKLNLLDPVISDSLRNETAAERFEYSGTGSAVINELKARFDKDDSLRIVTFDNRIKAYRKGDGKPYQKWNLNMLSSPPQLVGGGEEAAVATINAPWIPGIRPGDLVTFNTQNYSTSRMVTYKRDKMQIEVNTIQVHFSTVGSVNQMTIMGIAVNE